MILVVKERVNQARMHSY